MTSCGNNPGRSQAGPSSDLPYSRSIISTMVCKVSKKASRIFVLQSLDDSSFYVASGEDSFSPEFPSDIMSSVGVILQGRSICPLCRIDAVGASVIFK